MGITSALLRQVVGGLSRGSSRRNPLSPRPRRRRRTVGTSILVAAIAAGGYYAKQKGWIGSPAAPSNSTHTGSAPNSGSSKPSDAPRAETKNSTADTPTRSAKPAPAPQADEDGVEDASAGTTAAERASRPAVKGAAIAQLFADKQDHVWVEGTGKVVRILSDDDMKPMHQRFLIDIASGSAKPLRVMVLHNIDTTPRANVKEGDSVTFRGEYLWGEEGGKVHFTHKPQYGKFQGGYIEVGGKRFE